MLSTLKRIAGRVARATGLKKSPSFDANEYWETRYAGGGTSGDGSYGKLAVFKAEVINRLIEEHDLNSLIEFGCGDGNQLAMFEAERYVGLDVAPSAIERCRALYAGDDRKTFEVYDPATFAGRADAFRADAALSLDVIYHITDDADYEAYLADLFRVAEKLVVIYSTDFDEVQSAHVRHRPVSDRVAQTQPTFELLERIPNPYPGRDTQRSDAEFMIYRRMDA